MYCSLFVVYGDNPTCPLNLISIPTEDKFSSDEMNKTDQIKKLHEKVRASITTLNAAYLEQPNKHLKFAEFKEGDLV